MIGEGVISHLPDIKVLEGLFSIEKDCEEAKKIYESAKSLQTQKKFDKALEQQEKLKKLILERQIPNERRKKNFLGRIMVYIAYSLLRLKRFADAIRMAAEALIHDSSSAAAYLFRGLAHVKQNNLDAAKKDLFNAREHCQSEKTDAKDKIETILTKVMTKEVGGINPDDESS